MNGKIIRYFGGKGGIMIKELTKYFPTREIYIEPFGGSATLLLNQKSKVEIYNDLNKNVYSLFKVISDENLFHEFKRKLDLTYYSEDLRTEFKQLIKNDNISIIERAFYYFYINRTSHNGVGGFTSNLSIRRNMAKCVSDYLSAIDGLQEFHQRLSSVIVRNVDAIKIIKEHDAKNVFMYLDPPYHHSTRTNARYETDMDNKQHEILIATILNCKSKIMISGYDNPLYNLLTENGWYKHQFQVNTVSGTNESKTKIETIWLNYQSFTSLFQ